ncbi:HAMP domain-containing sensor histidine kinase [Saxibacter everestensis]|uniref:histidine kinase n=1 Tax=Saxibacter everestensis TaxID=2909229 RepID=A0ABY8QS93_9MICO|nr:HAMP domain-containing sensor histidine kinase [Brevibacteriaceae bacterium ZFBP1038]
MSPSLFKSYFATFFSDRPHRMVVAQQLPFVIVFVLVSGFIAAYRTDIFMDPQYLTGFIAVLLVTIVARFVRWWHVSTGWIAAVPVIDFVSVAICRDVSLVDTTTLSLLCFFPALWLALLLKGRGIVLATILTVVGTSLPSIFRITENPDPFIVARHLLMPLVIFMITSMVVAMREQLVSRRNRLAQTAGELRVQLATTQRSERLLDNIINSVNVAILVIDKDGNDVITNSSQDTIHALASPPGNADKTEAGHLIFHADRTTPFAAEERAAYRAAQGETFTGLTMFLGDDPETQRAVSASAQPIIDENGKREGSVVVFYDVTSFMDSLQAKESFVSTVSHELRTPITSIIGYLDLVLENEEPRSEEAETYLGVISRNAEQVLKIVEDLLISAQAADGKLKLHREPTDVAKFVRRTVESAQPRADARNIELRHDCAETPKVAVDPARIAQVLDNLISNAIKFTGKGGAVTVRARPASHAVIVEVADTGIGMSPQEISGLFTRFFRTPSAKRKAIPGIGLGLSISKEIIESHGGSISVDSTPGVGTTFRVTLPYDLSIGSQ